MINNRQGGRRRGRGGGPRSPNQGSNLGNRQDNRSRGNAAQLLEKYKSLARDAQLQGDRVQSEYFLQFADHYYRVLNENRARFEEQRRQHGQDDYDEEGEDEGLAAEGSDGDGDGRDEQPQRRPYRDERPRYEGRPERAERQDERPRYEGRPERQERQDERSRYEGRRDERQEPRQDERPREERAESGENGARRRRGRRDFNGAEPREQGDDLGEARIALESLPPAIAANSGAPAEDAGEEARPRRRTRRPRAEEGGEDLAPAA